MGLYKKIFLLIISLILYSCNLQGSCEIDKKQVAKIECLQIVKKLPFLADPYLGSKGTHLLTGKHCKCIDGRRILSRYRDVIEKGDTIIKRKGELTYSIHKKDTVIVFTFECNDGLR